MTEFTSVPKIQGNNNSNSTSNINNDSSIIVTSTLYTAFSF